MQSLAVSLVLSALLTVLLNVAVRLFPDASRRAAEGLGDLAKSNTDEGNDQGRTVRVLVPWKAMIIGSVVLTIVINVALWFTR